MENKTAEEKIAEIKEHVGCFLELDRNVKKSDVIGVSFENLIGLIASHENTQTDEILKAIEDVRDIIDSGVDESPVILLDELLTKFKTD